MVFMDGYPIVLTADRSMMSNYRGNYLFGFISCGPSEQIPDFVFDRLLAPSVKVKPGGEAECAPYGLRKVEASLLEGYGRDEVVVAHPDYVENFIGDETRAVGIEAMDPRGIGPVTSSFGSDTNTPYNRRKFRELTDRLRSNGHRHNFRVVLGGSGAWQFLKEEYREDYGIDHVVLGNIGKMAPEVFRSVMEGEAEEVISLRGVRSMEEIEPLIVGPSLNALVEIMRGCGRGCDFCSPTMRKKLDMPPDRVLEEVEVNRRCFRYATLHSDDFLLYRCDNRDFYPNRDAIIDLFSQVRSLSGVDAVAPTHCSLAPVAADEELIGELSKICRPKPGTWLGIQPGIETGSPRLIEKHMRAKARPFSPGEWPEVVRRAVRIFNDNRWYVAATLIVGLPGEEDEDVQDTLDLVADLSERDCILAPLLFVDYEAERQMGLGDLTDSQWELFYRCWRHNLRQFEKWAWTATEGWNPITRAVTSYVLAPIGTRKIRNKLREIDQKRRQNPDRSQHQD